MADRAAQTTFVAAPLERCYQVALDFERYPDWARDVKEARVLERDEQGRASKVEFRASALGRSTRLPLVMRSCAACKDCWRCCSVSTERSNWLAVLILTTTQSSGPQPAAVCISVSKTTCATCSTLAAAW